MNTRKIVRRIFGYGLVVLIFFYISRILSARWQEIREYDFTIDIWHLFLSLVFYLLNIYAFALIWKYALKKLDNSTKLSDGAAILIFVRSWFGKYLPGKMWGSLGKVYFGAEHAIDKRILGLSAVLELSLSLLSHAFVSTIFMVLLLNDLVFDRNLLFLVVIFVLVLLPFTNKNVMMLSINIIMRLLKKTKFRMDEMPGYRVMWELFLLYIVPTVCFSISFLFLVMSVIDIDRIHYVSVMGIFMVANLISKISFFIPAGIGVREGLLTGMLGIFLPLHLASLTSLLSRAWFVLIDLVLLAFVSAGLKMKKIN